MNNTYNRLLNLVVNEGQATGHSPTQTGRRVGRAIADLEKNPDTTPEHLAKKKVQGRRIADKTSTRQAQLRVDSHKRAGHSDRDSSYAGSDTYASSRERFGKNYRAGKKDVTSGFH